VEDDVVDEDDEDDEYDEDDEDEDVGTYLSTHFGTICIFVHTSGLLCLTRIFSRIAYLR
jgi:hypothetical protein